MVSQIVDVIKGILRREPKAAGHILHVRGYQINMLEQIGRGGFGTVYKATTASGTKVAAKFLSSSETRRQSTVDEIIKFHRMPKNHDNIVEMLCTEYHIPSGGLWIMMEYCEYGDLETYFRSHPDQVADVDHKINIMIQIMSGICYLHSQDVVHRDIKPGNILVQKKEGGPLIRLADFGLSKFLDPEGNTSSMSSNVGTLSFKAPEFFKKTRDGKLHYHRNVDVFAAGLTFLTMMQFTEGGHLVPRAERSLDLNEDGMPIGLTMRGREMARPPQPSLTLVVIKPEDDVKVVTVKTLSR